MTTKEDILQNEFTSKLRMGFVVDRNEYDKLCAALRALAGEWRGNALIDKELVQELYVIAPIAKNAASALRDQDPKKAEEIEGLAIELDALVLDCLAT